jgi:hyperosmotically inducible periplasmic protein
MHNFSRKTLLLSSVLALGSCSGAWATAQSEQSILDTRQETQIWTTYQLSPYLRANDLKVSVHGGKATISGYVDETVSKELANEIALGVPGITDVSNQIEVQTEPTAPKSGAERRYGDKIDDANITTSIKSKLLWSKYPNSATTAIETNSGKVILRGTTDSTEDKTLATRLATNSRGVVAVDNQLVIEPSPKQDAAKNATNTGTEQEISDSWITAKVKSTFLYSNSISMFDIAVTTEKGVVTLVGKLDSGAERKLAIELAQNVKGVKSVKATDLAI